MSRTHDKCTYKWFLLNQEVLVDKQTMLHFDVFNSIKVSHNLLLGHKRGTEKGFPFLYFSVCCTSWVGQCTSFLFTVSMIR